MSEEHERQVDRQWLKLIGFLVLLFLGLATFTVASACFESNTHNRLTGAHTTMWDALWVELRVMDAPRKDAP